MGAQADGPRASLEEQERLHTFEPEGDFDFCVGVDCHVFGLLAERLMPQFEGVFSWRDVHEFKSPVRIG
jgi:hypothetical protein